MTKTALLLAAALATAVAGSASAQSVNLTTGSGDGSLSIDVTGNGSSAHSGNGIYDPIGSGAAASTVYDSYLLYRLNSTDNRSLFTSSSLVGNGTTATSTLTGTGIAGTLIQTVAPTFQDGSQTGSLLTQTYTFTNTTSSAITLDLLRYLDGDLRFDGSLIDGGGKLTAPDGSPLLFEIDSATGASTSNTFVGIYDTGGTSNGFQITQCCGANNNSVLNNTIHNDLDNNGFIDPGQGFDVTLNLSSLLSIGAGGTGTFTSYTIFGTGAPGAVVVPGQPSGVPEPAAWAMMLIGVGAVGANLRRRRQATNPALSAA